MTFSALRSAPSAISFPVQVQEEKRRNSELPNVVVVREEQSEPEMDLDEVPEMKLPVRSARKPSRARRMSLPVATRVYPSATESKNV